MNVEQDLTSTLQRLLDRARAALRAHSVVVLTREAEAVPALIVSRERHDSDNERLEELLKESGLATRIYKTGSAYLQSEIEYREFISKQDTKEVPEDSWSRENIQSSAFIRLGEERDPLGVMLVNYRTPQSFDSSTRELIETFAFMTGLAIHSHKLSIDFWEQQRARSLSASISEIVYGLAHNSGNLVFSINAQFGGFSGNVRKTKEDKIDKYLVEDFLKRVQEPLNELYEDFRQLKEYRSLDAFVLQPCHIHELIHNSLLILRNRFENQRIAISTRYAQVPQVTCDKGAIQHVLLNLLMNAGDAIRQKGVITVQTDVSDGYVRIRIADTGPGIPVELRSKIFEPLFTTKARGIGSGLGLPVSRYIVSKHDGRIEFTSNRKGTTFSVYLPIGESAVGNQSK